jgi:hypothetical protein
MNRFLYFLLAIFIWSCSNLDEEIDCSTLKITLKSKTDPTLCSPPNGSIQVFATGGRSPYVFSLNNSDFQSDSLFSGLQGGNYQVIVMDASQCTNTIEVSLTNFNSDLATTVETIPDTECLTGTGIVRFIPTGGTPPYQLRFQNSIVENSLEVGGLKSGSYQGAIIDSQMCEFVMAVTIPKGKTTISWSVDIKPIIDTRCAKPICHVSTTGRADLTKFENVKQLATEIKTRTQTGSMPFDEPMPASQIQLIACWVDDGALNN